MDVHRGFCDVAIYEDGKVRLAGRVESSPEQLGLFAQSLCDEDHVALETTGNALSIARILEGHVGGVLVADTRNVRAMTHAKVKNDRVDACMLANCSRRGCCPARGCATSPRVYSGGGSRGATSSCGDAPARGTRSMRC
jgi:hypothetical protein